jgi:hypothetical protein
VGEGIPAALFLQVAQEIEIEEILEGAATEGTRFEFGQINIAQCEYAEALVKGAGSVPGGKDNRDFVSLR